MTFHDLLLPFLTFYDLSLWFYTLFFKLYIILSKMLQFKMYPGYEKRHHEILFGNNDEKCLKLQNLLSFISKTRKVTINFASIIESNNIFLLNFKTKLSRLCIQLSQAQRVKCVDSRSYSIQRVNAFSIRPLKVIGGYGGCNWVREVFELCGVAEGGPL